MDKREAIEFLRRSLGEIRKLITLPHDNQEYPLWYKIIEDILEEVFGQDSTEYLRFADAWPHSKVAGYERDAYLEELKLRETAILSIIKKYEMLGTEGEKDNGGEVEMNESQKVRLMTELLLKVTHLKQINHDNNEYRIWRGEVQVTLESLFGRNSTEYNRFFNRTYSHKMYATEAEKQQEYLSDLDTDEKNLATIIAMQEKREEIESGQKFQRLLHCFISHVIKFWHWLKSHKIPSIIVTVIIVGVTLLGTNWTTVWQNFIKFLDFFR